MRRGREESKGGEMEREERVDKERNWRKVR